MDGEWKAKIEKRQASNWEIQFGSWKEYREFEEND